MNLAKIRSKISSRIIVVVGLRGFAALAVLVLNFVVARTLNLHDAGLFFLAFAFLQVASAFCRLGFDNVVVREVAIAHAKNKHERISQIMGQSVKLVFLVSVVCSLITVLLTPYLGQLYPTRAQQMQTFGIFALAIPFVSAGFIYAYAFQGIEKTNYSVFFLNVFLPVLVVIALGVAAGAGLALTIHQASLIMVTAAVLLWGMAWLGWRKQIPKLPITGSGLDSALLKSAMTLWLVTVFAQVLQWGMQLAASFWLSAEDVARLSVAHRLSFLISMPLIITNVIYAPRFAKLYAANNLADLKKVAYMATRVGTALALVPLLIYFLAPGLVLSIFGHGYTNATTLLIVFAGAQFVNVATGPVGQMLIMSGFEKDIRTITVIVLGMGLPGVCVLTSCFGLWGSAVAMASVIAVQNVVVCLMAYRRLGINTLAALKFW